MESIQRPSVKYLEVNLSACVKNTNCPLQMIIKIDVKGRCYMEVEWKHKHSVETLKASNSETFPLNVLRK